MTTKKTTLAMILALSLALVAGPALAGRGHGGPGNGGPGNGGAGNLACMATVISGMPFQEVDDVEQADLEFMWQEEKMARDVYAVLYEEWGLRVFANIGRSEQRHMDSVALLFEKYDLALPMADDIPGTFADPGIQALYDDLVAQGKQSLVDALVVGATIEDKDIADLYEDLGHTDNEDIRLVYQNLAKGSRNHLRSFMDLLQRNGATYEPQFLDQATFDEILSTPRERGMVNADGEPDPSLCPNQGPGNRRNGRRGGRGGRF